MRDAPADYRNLGLRLGIGVVAAVVVVVLGRVVKLDIAPIPAVIVCLVLAAVSWMFTEAEEPAAGPLWRQPHPQVTSSRFSADVRTRRLATMLSHAQPGQIFEAGTTARLLATLTTTRLVRRGLLSPDAPLTDAAPHLSPALLGYLRSAESDKPQVLSRRALHAHLKEIDQL